MNKLLQKIERKIGRYAIQNLSLYIIIAYVIGYVLALTGSVDFISLNPYYISRGQVWRIITWILVPPSRFDLFTIIMLFFYYQLGTVLERTWGTFRYNVYIFSGILFSVIGAVVLYVLSVYGGGMDPLAAGIVVSSGFSTYFINLSIFLAFAAIYPNMQVLLFFVIPVKIKWLGIVYVITIGYQFLNSGISAKFAIVMSLLNFIVFFFSTRDYRRVSPKEILRKQKFKRAMNGGSSFSGRSSGTSTTSGNSNGFNGFSNAKTPSGIAKHKCAICGRTDKEFENMEFRFCSKCNGNYEYCSDHLFTHEHVK